VTTAPGDSGKLAERLNHLFATVHRADHGPYNNEEVARETGVSRAYIAYLRKGERENPTLATLQALARFFGVKTAYFFDDQVAESTDAQLGILVAMRDARVSAIAMRAADLSDRGLDALADIVEQVRGLEGLPADRANERRPDPGRERRGGETGA
jgi:transcriptional regulator with XRE-family HTH domain